MNAVSQLLISLSVMILTTMYLRQMAKIDGKNPTLWGWLGFLLSPISLIIYLFRTHRNGVAIFWLCFTVVQVVVDILMQVVK